MRGFYCPFCETEHYAGACVHVEKVKFDKHGNITEVQFRGLMEMAKLPPEELQKALKENRLPRVHAGEPQQHHIGDQF